MWQSPVKARLTGPARSWLRTQCQGVVQSSQLEPMVGQPVDSTLEALCGDGVEAGLAPLWHVEH